MWADSHTPKWYNRVADIAIRMTDLAYNQGFLNTRKMSIIEAMRKNKQKQFLVNEQNSQWEK